MSDFQNRTYAFINSSDTGSINYSEVVQNSENALRKSVDGSLVLLKWETANWPSFISPSGSVTPTWQGTHSECITQLTSSTWTPPNPPDAN